MLDVMFLDVLLAISPAQEAIEKDELLSNRGAIAIDCRAALGRFNDLVGAKESLDMRKILKEVLGLSTAIAFTIRSASSRRGKGRRVTRFLALSRLVRSSRIVHGVTAS
jgi:hypothetical protein